MATLIEVSNNDGLVGRCDGKCHNADPSSPCNCVCEGINHGVGQTKALDNTSRLAEEWRDIGYKVRIAPIQLALGV